MINPRVAARYAKSLIDLSLEKQELESTYQDMLYLQSVCRKSREFVSLLRSPVIKGDKKASIIRSVTSGKVNALTEAFVQLLVNKGRETNLPEITDAFIDQYKKHKKIYSIRLTTATPVSESVKEVIVKQVKDQTEMKNIELETVVNQDLIGGFQLRMGDRLVDASIAYDLNKVKAQFLSNDFVYKIR